jgi:hypothetical protein
MPAELKPAVVVVAYNRTEALRRLLDSLLRAEYPTSNDVSLVISIDRGEDARSTEVAALADAVVWPFGTKEVVRHERHLGLVEHFLACGRLTQRFGGTVILEDDLVVAPAYYAFASQALSRYADAARAGGVCLYGLWFNGFTHDPFVPIDDGSDVFFMKLPYTQGLAFTAAQWQAFESWRRTGRVERHPDLPGAFLRFGREEWFPSLAAYLATEGRFFCFPRVSLTAGWGDSGTHFGSGTSWFQTPLALRPREYALPALDDALAVYDSFYELLPDRLRRLTPSLPEVDFDVDLNAAKRRQNLHHELVLTTRPVRRAMASFGLEMQPLELNLVYGVPGEAISLSRRGDVYWDAIAGTEARRRLHAFAWSRYRPSRRRAAWYAFAKLVHSLRTKGRSGGRA